MIKFATGRQNIEIGFVVIDICNQMNIKYAYNLEKDDKKHHQLQLHQRTHFG